MPLKTGTENCVIVLCVFLLCLYIRLCEHLYLPPIREGMRDKYTFMNPDVEITVFKIVYYGILIMLEIKLITKT